MIGELFEIKDILLSEAEVSIALAWWNIYAAFKQND